MKINLVIIFLFILSIDIYAQNSTCKFKCNDLSPDNTKICVDKFEECKDQIQVDTVKALKKTGVTDKGRIKVKNDIRKVLRDLNKEIAASQLRRAMYRKLLERATQLILIDEQ